MSSEHPINIDMGQELTLKEVNSRYPSGPGITVFKSWFNTLMKASGVDEAAFWGNDAVSTIPTGNQYKITMSKANMTKVRKTLNSSRRPTFRESKYAIVYDNPAGDKPIKIEFGVPGDKVILFFLLDSTGKKPRGSGKTSQKPSTKQQEMVTLKIFEELISSATTKWDNPKSGGYKKLRDTVLKKIWPDIDHPEREDWDKHFELQFNEVRNETKLPNNNFNVYSYTQFMDFIDKWVTQEGPRGSKGPWPVAGNISKKDSWNPADIWLVKSGNEYKDYIERIKTAPKIDVINGILREAFNAMVIVGISLKKSSGKKLFYDLLNLESQLPSMPPVEFGVFKIDLPYDDAKKEFTKTTNNLTVKKKGGTTVGEMRIGTNTTKKGNNTYEFKAAGAASAQLGKVPKDLMLERLQQILGTSYSSLPTWSDVQDNMIDGITDKTHYRYWKVRVDAIIKNPGNIFQIDPNVKEFPNNMLDIGVKPIKKTEAAAGQIVEFAYLLTQMSKPQLNNFVEDCYYYAQKKGASVRGHRFGPFGKLH